MRDNRAAVIVFPSDHREAEPAPQPGRYVIRACRAVALVAIGAAMHLALPDHAALVVPVITPARFAPPSPRPSARRVVVEQSTVVAQPLELDSMRDRRDLRLVPTFGDVSVTRSASLAGPSSSPVAVPTSGTAGATAANASDEESTVPTTDLPAAHAAAIADSGNLGSAPLPRGGDVVRAVHEPASAASSPIVESVAMPAAREAHVISPVREAAHVISPVREAHVISEEELVRRLLDEYAGAYERLDVGAAKAVWPTVDGKALKRAFAQLSSQRVTLQSCGITISGSTANARCRGSATYQPRIGSRPVQIASREWTFDLSKQDAHWRIVNTLVR